MLTVLGIISIGIFIFYYKTKAAKPKVFSKENSSFERFILSTCPILNSYYFPTWWAPTGHATTILRHFIQKRLNLASKQEELYTTDGGNFIVDWFPQPQVGNNAVLVLIPGITANSRSPYVEEICSCAIQQGFQVVVCNHRGSRGEKIIGDKIYSAVETNPLSTLLDCITNRHPHSKIIALGVSLGGMILTKYLSDVGNESKVLCAMSICMPWDCFQTQNALEKSFLSRVFYNRKITGNLMKFACINYELINRVTGVTKLELEGLKVISDFDSSVIVPMYGYSSIEDYYNEASPIGRLKNIKIPFICLNTRDDPFVPWTSVPVGEFFSSNSLLIVTEAGGHVGFQEGTIPSKSYYLNRLLKELLHALIMYSES